jgi:3-deoxy-D-manno-octulosonic-acid transferase
MSERWATTALQTYRWLGSAIYPFIGTYLAIRASRGKEEHSRRRERYGRSPIARPGRSADLGACGQRRRNRRGRGADPCACANSASG